MNEADKDDGKGAGPVLCVLMLGAGWASGQQVAAPVVLHGKTMLLWPGGAPGALGDAEEDKPTADGLSACGAECD